MNDDNGGDDGEYRTADPPASGGAAIQSGGGAGQAATDWGAHYAALRRAGYDHTLASIAVANAQHSYQRTGLMRSMGGNLNAQAALLPAMPVQQQAMQNAARWNNPYGMPYTSACPIIGGGGGGLGLLQVPRVDPCPPPPVESVGISAGEILGHRVWRYGNAGHLLQSMALEHIWPLGPLHDPKVGDHNRHGIHAFKTAEGVINEYQPSQGFWGETKLVYGTVALWGTVIEHERGYRSEFAHIHSLDSIPQLYRWKELRLLRELRQRYGLTGDK